MTGARLLAAVGVVALAAFVFQIERSPFLRIEAEDELAGAVAAEVGLAPLDVMALRELLGAALGRDELVRGARQFVRDRGAFASDDLAAVAAVGHRSLVERLLRDAGGDAARAELALRPLPEAIWAVRFRSVRERLASRRG